MSVQSTEFIEKRQWQSAVGVPALYFAASCIACGADFSVTVGLSTAAAAPAALAATVGYLFGIAVHWILSTRFVFPGASATSPLLRRRQKALFLLTGLVGLSATVAIYTYASALRIGPAEAKTLAVLGSFLITYLCRRHFLFRGERVA